MKAKLRLFRAPANNEHMWSTSPSSTGKNAEIVRPDAMTGVRISVPPLVCVSL